MACPFGDQADWESAPIFLLLTKSSDVSSVGLLDYILTRLTEFLYLVRVQGADFVVATCSQIGLVPPTRSAIKLLGPLGGWRFRRMAQVAAVEERVRDIVAEQLGVDKDKVSPDTSFVNDLGADSLDTVELVMELEEEFDISIPDDAAEKIQTVGQAIEFIEKAQAS